MMNRQELYDIWAPPCLVWSAWAKPVLFAHADEALAKVREAQAELDVATVGPADGTTAIVVDLPGAAGVSAGMSLARRGYRPVPLYNACPLPAGARLEDDEGRAVCPVALVNVKPIVEALVANAGASRELRLGDDAPPAFLLDASRRIGEGLAAEPGRFDNRSLSLPTDFPSANTLLSAGIRRAILLQSAAAGPQADLAHTLRRWQEAGIAILAAGLAEDGLRPIDVPRPSGFRSIFYGFMALLGFHRSVLGGFGGELPEPSSG